MIRGRASNATMNMEARVTEVTRMEFRSRERSKSIISKARVKAKPQAEAGLGPRGERTL